MAAGLAAWRESCMMAVGWVRQRTLASGSPLVVKETR